MTSAVDKLIAAALASGNPELMTIATEAQKEQTRGPGQPKAELPHADDPEVRFMVFDMRHNQRFTGDVYFVDGDPVAVVKPRKETATAIAIALGEKLGYSRNTVLTLVKDVINHLEPKAAIPADLSVLGQLKLVQKSVEK